MVRTPNVPPEEEEGPLRSAVGPSGKKPSIASHRSVLPPTQQLASPLILPPRTGRPPGVSPAARRTDSARDFGRSTRSSQPSMPPLRARARLWNRSRPGRPPSPDPQSPTKAQRSGVACSGTYNCPVPHCTSSTISRLLWRMNWFMCRAASLNRDMPSPPCFDVPNSCSNSGLSCVPTMAK